MFVRPEEVVAVSYEVAAIFRDYGYRKNRSHARLKFLLQDWGITKFRQVLEERLGRRLADNPGGITFSLDSGEDHLGTNLQKNGRYSIGLATLRGRLSTDHLISLAGLAERYGSGQLRTTIYQNIILLDIAPSAVKEVEQAVAELDLPANTNPLRRGITVCTGLEFCKQAVVETKERAADIILDLEKELPGFAHRLSINISGCPNSCTRYQIADIGLLGSLGRSEAGSEGAKKGEVFQVYLGGRLGNDRQLGYHLKRRIPVEKASDYLVSLLKRFETERRESETFTRYINRHTLEELESLG